MRKIYLISSVLFLFLFLAQTNLPGQAPRPTTTVNPNTGSPTASVFVDGLSILYYSSTGTEIGFVKDHHSDIIVEVYTKRNCQPYPPGRSLKLKRNEKPVKIEVEKANAKNGGVFYVDNQNRQQEDFSFMPDMCGEFWYPGKILGVKPQKLSKPHLAGKLILNGAVFYTKQLAGPTGAEQTNLENGDPRTISKVGKTLGADITCEPGVNCLNIKITGNLGTVSNIALPQRDAPYYIVVRTDHMTRDNHLHFLYDYIVRIPSGEPRYDFKYQAPEPHWHPCRPNFKATEYACQTFGGCGSDTLPEFP